MVIRRVALTQLPCAGCPNAQVRNARWVGGRGPDQADLVVVGEAPGDTETVTGKPFVGPSGQLLDAVLEQHGIKRSSVYATNSVMCPIKPNSAALDACHGRLLTEIKSRKPKLVLALGKIAFNQLTGSRAALTDNVGTLLHPTDLDCWVLPTWHPAAALRSDSYFPDISNAVWRASLLISGRAPFPRVGEKTSFPWTFFQTEEGILKALRYYLRQVPRNGKLLLSTDTESVSTGRWPHPEFDEWIMWQFYDGKRAAALNMRVGLQSKAVRELGKRLLTHPQIEWSMHNGAVYDNRVFRHNLQVAPADPNVRDTLVLGIGLSERASAIGLEPLSRQYLGAPAYKGALKASGYKHAKGPQNDKQWRTLARYGVEDAYLGYGLAEALPPLVQEEGTADLVKKVLMPLALTCGRIARRGFPIDIPQASKLQQMWGAKANEYVANLQELAEESGWPLDPSNAKAKDGRFNPRSHIQLSHLCYDVLGLSATDGTSNRKYTSKWDGGRSSRSVDQDFLMGHEDEPVCQLMSRLRIYDKLVRTYVKTIEREISLDPHQLIHPDFHLGKTGTGRLVVRPLLQVLPHYGAHSQLQDEDFAQETRRMFPARPGYVIVSADFKQLEFRVAWALSGDKNLGEALMSGDMHARTAAYMFRKDESTVTSGDRHAAKRVSFGTAYNRSAYTLSRGPLLEVLGGIEVSEFRRQALAQKFIDDFWALYSDYDRFKHESIAEAFKNGELQTPFGRKRRWMLITDRNQREVENQAVNFPIQSTASDMCSTALINLGRTLPQRGLGFPLYTVHDEIVAELKIETLAEGIECMREVMEHPPFNVGAAQFPVDVKVGPNLGDLEAWKG